MNSNKQGAWIFVSHSSKDLIEVRRIRNFLEEKGHSPLLFHLKCLEDESEINDIIKREIEARNWFVLCDSKNAKASKYVTNEINYIKQLDNKVFEIIELDKNLDKQLFKLERLSKRITLFPSYDFRNPKAQQLLKIFKENDYAVYDMMEFGKDLSTLLNERRKQLPYWEKIKSFYRGDLSKQFPGLKEEWFFKRETKIERALNDGFFVFIISDKMFEFKNIVHNTLVGKNSETLMKEAKEEKLKQLKRAFKGSKTGNNIIVISLTKPEKLEKTISKDILNIIGNHKIWDLSNGNLNKHTLNLINELKIIELD